MNGQHQEEGTIRGKVAFVTRDRSCNVMPEPFANDGSLDPSQVEWHDVVAKPLSTIIRLSAEEGVEQERSEEIKQHVTSWFARTGLVAVDLQSSLTEDQDENDDGVIRNCALSFLTSELGKSLLRARFFRPSSHDDDNHNSNDPSSFDIIVRPTHVTRRKVPPDGMSLVHVDYPRSHTLQALLTEWWSRWRSLLLLDGLVGTNLEEIAQNYDLVGVVTLWICLQKDPSAFIEDHPLIVADASTCTAQDTTIYKVGRTRHSVGVYHNPRTCWYHLPRMRFGEAWLFDTRANPHVSVSTGHRGDPPDFVRRSCEVRCLILLRRTKAGLHR